MARRSGTSPGAVVVVVGLLGLGLLILVLKWLLITAAILVVPFGVWWVWDRQHRDRTGRHGEALADRRG